MLALIIGAWKPQFSELSGLINGIRLDDTLNCRKGKGVTRRNQIVIIFISRELDRSKNYFPIFFFSISEGQKNFSLILFSVLDNQNSIKKT